jgi:hypothetical protein
VSERERKREKERETERDRERWVELERPHALLAYGRMHE